jgi:predicted DNA-binding protein (MmcQ/YjbR family)
MNRAAWRRHLAAMSGSIEEQPFGPGVFVYKIGGRIFALLTEDGEPPRLSLKCDPERALHLRAAHAAVEPGYHLNKEHWNTLLLDGSLPEALVFDLVEHSWERVAAGLPKSVRSGLELRKEQG